MLTRLNMRKYLVLLCWFLLVVGLQTAGSQPAMPVFDGIDGYWYIDGSSVKKMDSQGEILATYSNIALGNPSLVDASDPFRVMVFYTETQTVVILNSNASVVGTPINLTDFGLGEIPLVCRSSRGGFWILDITQGQIMHFSETFKPTSMEISVGSDYQFSPKSFLIEHNGTVYLGSIGKNISRWDLYGAELESVDVTYDALRFEGNYLWVKKNDEIVRVNLNEVEPDVKYACPCNALPLSVQGQTKCFDGASFKLCKKID